MILVDIWQICQAMRMGVSYYTYVVDNPDNIIS